MSETEESGNFAHARILITGGTGSLGQALVKRFLTTEAEEVHVFSRDEEKQDRMKKQFVQSSDRSIANRLYFHIGDVRDERRLESVVTDVGPEIVVHAAALKQVPNCEEFPQEAVKTNILGVENLISACSKCTYVQTVIGVSTDKACKPINAMGASKFMQERLLIAANSRFGDISYLCVRYGNVLNSRGSVIPFFHDRIRQGLTLPVTDASMTRFLLPLSHAVDTVFIAIENGNAGEIIIPEAPAAKMWDLAEILFEENLVSYPELVGIRPGEKIHEVLISEEESRRLRMVGTQFAPGMERFTTEPYRKWMAIMPSILYQIEKPSDRSKFNFDGEYSSSVVMPKKDLRELLHREKLIKP